MKPSTATIAGFVVAPVVPVVVMAALDGVHAHWSSFYFAIALWIYAYALVTMLIVGVPMYLLLRKWSLMRWWWVVLIGLVVGVVMGYVFQMPFRRTPVDSAVVQGVACALAGWVFWVVWRMGQSSTGVGVARRG